MIFSQNDGDEISMETRGRGRIRVLKDSCAMHRPMITVEDESVYVKAINNICLGIQTKISNDKKSKRCILFSELGIRNRSDKSRREKLAKK